MAALVTAVRAQLVESGSAQVAVDDLRVPVDVWRRAARRAGRELNRPVATVAGHGFVHAVLSDWPATDEERRVQAAALRRAVHAAAAVHQADV